MAMFDNLRNKFQTVQEGLTASFRGSPKNAKTQNLITDSCTVNLNSGAELLNKYQSEWKEIHILSEQNAELGQQQAERIADLHGNIEKQWKDIGRMCVSLTSIPPLVKSIQDLIEQLSTIHILSEDVENGLINLENIIETQEFQEKQLEHRFQFALFQEKKLAELDKVREKVIREHAEKIKRHEMKQQELLQERQEAFKQAFDSDIAEFKLSGHLPKLESVSRTPESGPSLDEVTLEPDDPIALDRFLDSTSSNEG